MDIRIQHIKIIKKSDVSHFYQEMLLTFTFNENSTSLFDQLLVADYIVQFMYGTCTAFCFY